MREGVGGGCIIMRAEWKCVRENERGREEFVEWCEGESKGCVWKLVQCAKECMREQCVTL